jgi:hypothetical protein
MSDSRNSFWGYMWKNDNYKRSRWGRQHNNIYTRQPANNKSVLQTAQDGWNKMTNYLLHGDSNGS